MLLCLLHVPTMTSVHAWTEGEKAKAVERLKPLLKARVEHRDSSDSATSATAVRRYPLGPSQLVRHQRSGRTTGRLTQVLDGDLSAFLSFPRLLATPLA